MTPETAGVITAFIAQLFGVVGTLIAFRKEILLKSLDAKGAAVKAIETAEQAGAVCTDTHSEVMLLKERIERLTAERADFERRYMGALMVVEAKAKHIDMMQGEIDHLREELEGTMKRRTRQEPVPVERRKKKSGGDEF